jgi:uncharacterized protein involved in exopolysaccharide biosynthesis
VGVALSVFAVVVAFTLWMTPVYQVSSRLIVDEKRSPLPDVYQSLTLQENVVSTEMEVLQSRALASEVVGDYALQFTVVSPRVPRSSLFATISVSPDAEDVVYRLTPRPNGRALLEDRTHNRQIGEFATDVPVEFPGGTFRLAAGAAKQPHIDFSVVGRAAAVELFQKQLKVDRPVRDANIVSIAYRGKDPELLRDVLNSLTSRFIEAPCSFSADKFRS